MSRGGASGAGPDHPGPTLNPIQSPRTPPSRLGPAPVPPRARQAPPSSPQAPPAPSRSSPARPFPPHSGDRPTSPDQLPLPHLALGPPQRPVLGRLVLPARRRGGSEGRSAPPSRGGVTAADPHRAPPGSPSSPVCRQGLPGTSPTPARPGAGARVDQSLVLSLPTRSPPACSGLRCVLPRGLSSLEDTLIGLGVSASRARTGLLGRAGRDLSEAFPFSPSPACAGPHLEPAH